MLWNFAVKQKTPSSSEDKSQGKKTKQGIRKISTKSTKG